VSGKETKVGKQIITIHLILIIRSDYTRLTRRALEAIRFPSLIRRVSEAARLPSSVVLSII